MNWRIFLNIKVLLFWALACAVLVPVSAIGQINNDIEFGTENPIFDEFGNFLDGTPANPGDLVQILRTQGHIGIIPPDTNGSPNINNVVIKEVYVGNGLDPTNGLTGQFAGSFQVDRSVSNHIFARMFNGPTLAASSFYTDSQIKVINTTDPADFLIQAAQTTSEIDPADDDGDGLSNSWEKSLGTDKGVPDTDGDGITDYYEFLAGTDGLDDTDYLQMVELIRSGVADMQGQWSSTSGRVYQLEYTTNGLTDAVIEYVDLYGPVTSVIDQTSIVFTNGSLLNNPHFRVRLIP